MGKRLPTESSALRGRETEPPQDLVRWLVTLVICFTLLSAVLFPVFGPPIPTELAVVGFTPFLLMYTVALWLNRRGRSMAAANLYLWGTFLGQLGVMYAVEAFRTQALLSFVNLMLCAGFLKGRREALTMGLASVLAVIGSYLLDHYGLTPPSLSVTTEWVFLSVLCTLGTTSALVYIGTRFTSEAIERARISQAQAEEALEALEVAAEVDRGRMSRAKQLATMARGVVALRDSIEVSHEVARSLSEELGGVDVLIVDKRGHILSLSGQSMQTPTAPLELSGPLPAGDVSRAMTGEELEQVALVLGRTPFTVGSLVADQKSPVSMLLVGSGQSVSHRDWDWLLGTAWHVLTTGIHRIHVEQALSQSQRMDALGRLSAGIAHDFNNLLTTILGGAELVSAQVQGDDKAETYISGLREAAERAAGLSTKLMTFSSAAAVGPRDVDVVRLVEDLVPVLRGSVAETIEIDVLLPDQEAWVLADPVDLERALLNLVINARDAVGERGEIEIGVDVRDAQDGDSEPTVALWVEDTGAGMDAELQSRVFEPFFSTRRERGAAGLGLSIVYGVVQAMGGEVVLASDPGVGTRIEISLPQRPAAKADAAESTRPVLSTSDHRILVVEDDPDVRATICEMLGVGGYTVSTAVDGDAALRVLDQQGPFSLVLSDVVMPQMGGYELAQRLRERTSPPPLALVSGYAPTNHPGSAGEAIPMITKPFSLKKLLDFVADQVP